MPYFIDNAHNDDFPWTGTRLVILTIRLCAQRNNCMYNI